MLGRDCMCGYAFKSDGMTKYIESSKRTSLLTTDSDNRLRLKLIFVVCSAAFSCFVLAI